MKIAILGTLHKPISKNSLGGTEVFTYHLVEALVKKGHQVTLFADKKSKVNCRLISPNIEDDPNLTLDFFWPKQIASIMQAIQLIDQKKFDVVHNSTFETYPALPVRQAIKHNQTKFISTVHSDYFSRSTTRKFFYDFKQEKYVFVSKFAEKQSGGQFSDTSFIYNGIDVDHFPLEIKPKGNYFLYLGRINAKKGIVDAILASKKAGVKLVIAGVADSPGNQLFFNREVKPKINNKDIIFVGSVVGQKKIDLLKNALGLLFPVQWDEPFGLVAGEAMACGTPVLAYYRGALPELVTDGKTGFLVKEKDIDSLAKAIKKIDQIDRRDCGLRIREYFSLEKTVNNYEQIYKK